MPSQIPGAAPQRSFRFRIQVKRNPSEVKNLTEVPIWQLCHARQQPGAVPELPKDNANLCTRSMPDYEPKPLSLPLPGTSSETSGIAASILTAVNGTGSEETQNDLRHVAAPSPPRRLR